MSSRTASGLPSESARCSKEGGLPRRDEDAASGGRASLQHRVSPGMICRSLQQERGLPITQPRSVLIADSITRVGTDAVGAVVINGSHGGMYAAYVAAKLRVA